MKLVSFAAPGGTRCGCLRGDSVLDLTSAGLPADMRELVALAVANGMGPLEDASRRASATPLAEVKLLAPLPRPAKNIFCVGKNYHEHAREFAGSGFDASGKAVVPELAIFFSKPPTTVIGPDEPIPAWLDPTDPWITRTSWPSCSARRLPSAPLPARRGQAGTRDRRHRALAQ